MKMKGKEILVTGGAGFIGSHLVDELVERGSNVRVVDDFSRGKPENLEESRDEIDLVKGDLSVKSVAKKALKDIDICFHLAAVVGGVEFMNSYPGEILKTLSIDYNVIEMARRMDIERLLYTSSACVYPLELQEDYDASPLSEEDAFKHGANPDGEYGWAKTMGEIECQAYQESYGMDVAIVRPFNPYGPRESFDPKDSHVIPALIRKAVSQKNPLKVWGSGNQIRSFIYVEDLVRGMIDAAKKVTNAEVLNLSTANYTTIGELAKKILKLTNNDVSIIFDEDKPEGVKARKPDMSKTFRFLDWRPEVSLKEGIKKTINWYHHEITADH